MAAAIRPVARSPTFRCDPFLRDGVFDLGRVAAPCVTVLLMLPSALSTASASAFIALSRLNSPPRNDCCVRFATVVSFRPATLTTGPTLLATRTGLSPAGSRQLSWRTDRSNVSHQADARFLAKRERLSRHRRQLVTSQGRPGGPYRVRLRSSSGRRLSEAEGSSSPSPIPAAMYSRKPAIRWPAGHPARCGHLRNAG
jgi:hypothetical protein